MTSPDRRPGAPGSAFLPGDFAFPPKSRTADRESLLGISVAEGAGEKAERGGGS